MWPFCCSDGGGLHVTSIVCEFIGFPLTACGGALGAEMTKWRVIYKMNTIGKQLRISIVSEPLFS